MNLYNSLSESYTTSKPMFSEAVYLKLSEGYTSRALSKKDLPFPFINITSSIRNNSTAEKHII